MINLPKVAAWYNPNSWGTGGAQISNAIDRATGNTVSVPGTQLKLPWGVTPLLAGGALAGAAGHMAGQHAVRRQLEDTGATDEDIARAEYLSKGPKEGYGIGRGLAAGAAGIGAGLGTSYAVQRMGVATPAVGRGLGLAAGLGASFLASKAQSEAAERNRLKGLDY